MTEREKQIKTGEVPNERDSHPGRRMLDKATPALLLAMLVLTSIALVVAVGSSVVARDADTAAEQATRAAGVANATAERIEAAEGRSCLRIQKLRDEVNEQGKIIYLVLVAAGDSDSSQSDRYRSLVEEIKFLSPYDCEKAIQNPKYDSVPDVPWSRFFQDAKKQP